VNINDLYDSGAVRRYHTIPDYSGAQGQTVAEHCWGAALLAVELAGRKKMANNRVVVAMLTHDVEEAQTGDLPATVKWRYPQLDYEMSVVEQTVREELGLPAVQLTEDERHLCKWADYLELYAYAQRKSESCGSYRKVVTNVRRYLLTQLPQWPEALTLMQELTLGKEEA
jgi:5'-deoxynucleotidase YfbR-like HD superfamily hydrolase